MRTICVLHLVSVEYGIHCNVRTVFWVWFLWSVSLFESEDYVCFGFGFSGVWHDYVPLPQAV